LVISLPYSFSQVLAGWCLTSCAPLPGCCPSLSRANSSAPFRTAKRRYPLPRRATASAEWRLDEKQNSNAPDFGHGLRIVAENGTQNEAAADLNVAAAVLPN